MGTQYAIASVFSAVVGLYLLALLLRFLLQLARADFYNPASQVVVRVTDPMVRLFRGFIPGYRNFDFATLILAILVEAIAVYALLTIYGIRVPGIATILSLAVLGITYFIIHIYWYAIIASIIMSFVMMFSGNTNPHPLLMLVWQLTEPVMAPFRKLLPPMGGLDFSPIFVFILIRFLLVFLENQFRVQEFSLVIIGV